MPPVRRYSDPSHFVSITTTADASCRASARDAIERYNRNSGLRYRGDGGRRLRYRGDGYWQYNWKTPKSYAGQCLLMSLNLSDGTHHTTRFRFRWIAALAGPRALRGPLWAHEAD